MIKKVLSGMPSAFRWALNFIEKWFRNIMKQLSWVWKQSVQIYRKLVAFHTAKVGDAPDWASKMLYGLIIAAAMIPLFFFLVFWSLLKSL